MKTYVLTDGFLMFTMAWGIFSLQDREPAARKGVRVGSQSVTFRPDGHSVATGSLDGTAKLWDVETGKELRSFAGRK